MSLTTSASFTVDRLQYTIQIRAVSAELGALPRANRAEVVIAGGVDVAAKPGDSAELEIDGGDGAATIITGAVQDVSRREDATAVTVVDGGSALAMVRPQETYNSMLSTQIIQQLALLAGVGTNQVVATTQTSAYVADPRRTAAQHIAALADLAGAVATIDGNGNLSVMPWPMGLPTVAMRRDREFTAISTSSRRADHEFAVVGGGGAPAAAAPDAWVMSTDPLTNAEDPSPERTWVSQRVLRTATDVNTANRGAAARRAAGTQRFRGDCWLQPSRRPGEVVQIQETESGEEAGPWLITGVAHELGWDRSHTVLTGVSASGDTSQLGVLAGAVGGLL